MRISATLLESFRLLRDSDFVSAEELEQSIKGVFVPRREMELGTAFHEILENPERCRRADGSYAHEAIVFPADVVEPCLPIFDRSGLWEVKGTKDYVLSPHREPVRVVCKADQVVGSRGIENKTKWGPFDVDRYQDSFQWRFYLDVLGLSSITYNVFLLTEYADGSFGHRGTETFTLYPYPELGRDCEALLREFVAYVERQGLGSYLERPEAVGISG